MSALSINPWIFLLIAGVFELGFTTCLKLSENFSRVPFVIGFFLCGIVSFYSLNKSLTAIPLGTAYAVWTGIGAFGTAVIGMAFFGEPVNALRIALLCTLIGSIAGLKLIAN